jgi:hypothetical protein
MKIDNQTYYENKYKRGVYFQCGEKADHLDRRIDKNSFLAELVKGKKVIHLGCCDHQAVIDKKRKEGTWLHDILCKEADSCAGIDIDNAAVNYLTQQLGIQNIFCCDATFEIPQELKYTNWDYILAGETLEHIDNPVKFLTDIRNIYNPYVKEIILTVPNAFSYINFRNATKNFEANNPDHRYWFTPHTLGKVCFQSGFIPKDFYLINHFHDSFSSFHLKFLMRKFPMLRKNLVMVCSFS